MKSKFEIKNRKIKTNNFLLKIRNLVKFIPGAKIFYRKLIRKSLFSILFGHNFEYHMEGLITNSNIDFMKNQKFIHSYHAAMKQQYSPNLCAWKTHINQWAAFHAKNLEGDFVECGVYRGFHTMSNVNYINFETLKNRKYYLFDTFCGLDKELSSEEEYKKYKGQYPDTYDFVIKSFEEYSNVIVIKGSVPKVLSKVNIKKVAYLHIDMNCAYPERGALKYFWSKLVKGAVVILDDYCQLGHENQKKAIDNFVSSVGTEVLSLPTGQGMIIKSK